MQQAKSGQWHIKRNIFQRGQSPFPDFFPLAWNAFLPVENFHFGRPETNFSCFKTRKVEKKGPLPIFTIFILFPISFQFSTFPFTIFLLLFPIYPIFLASLIPVGYASESGTVITLFPTSCRECKACFSQLSHFLSMSDTLVKNTPTQNCILQPDSKILSNTFLIRIIPGKIRVSGCPQIFNSLS